VARTVGVVRVVEGEQPEKRKLNCHRDSSYTKRKFHLKTPALSAKRIGTGED
jgi:hypothetical protein